MTQLTAKEARLKERADKLWEILWRYYDMNDMACLCVEVFHDLKLDDASIQRIRDTDLPEHIRNASDREDWRAVGELDELAAFMKFLHEVRLDIRLEVMKRA